MTRALARRSPSRPPATACAALLAALLALAASATGFGASDATVTPSTQIVGMLALTEPSAKSADPPLCTDALAPLDADDCADVSYVGGSAKALRLGSLAGTDVQAASLRWQVTTTNPFGYSVQLSNPGPAPFLRGAAGSIPDMQVAAPFVTAAAVDDATHFGFAVGDPHADNEAAVDFVGSPWVQGGQQGEVFSGVPTAPVEIARRTNAQANDPFTITFAAASIAQQQPATGSYSGTVRIVASAL